MRRLGRFFLGTCRSPGRITVVSRGSTSVSSDCSVCSEFVMETSTTVGKIEPQDADTALLLTRSVPASALEEVTSAFISDALNAAAWAVLFTFTCSKGAKALTVTTAGRTRVRCSTTFSACRSGEVPKVCCRSPATDTEGLADGSSKTSLTACMSSACTPCTCVAVGNSTSRKCFLMDGSPKVAFEVTDSWSPLTILSNLSCRALARSCRASRSFTVSSQNCG